MKENSIEETIKQLKLILKIRKEQKEIIECAGGSCINCNPDIEALTNSIDILSDYKRVLKENEELKDKYATFVKMSSEVIANSIPVQKAKDKIEEILNNGEYIVMFEGNTEIPDNATTINTKKYIKLDKLQELIESEE